MAASTSSTSSSSGTADHPDFVKIVGEVDAHINEHRASLFDVKSPRPPPNAKAEDDQKKLVRLIARCFYENKQKWVDMEKAASAIVDSDYATVLSLIDIIYTKVNPVDTGLLQPVSNLAFLLTILKTKSEVIKHWN
jgi:hypothetical protein